MSAPRLLIASTAGVALIVGAVASLALGNWWLLVVVMGAHAAVSAAVIGYSWALASKDEDKPDPQTEAKRDEEAAAGGATPRAGRVAEDREVFN